MLNPRLHQLMICAFLSIVSHINGFAQSTAHAISFTYSLSTSAKTSAGIFKPDSTLVRTLWSNEQVSAGNHTAQWDGKDDAGNLASDGSYEVRVISNNVTYKWEGVLGNSSKYSSGTNVHHQAAEGFGDMVVADNKVFYVTEYNEGHATEFGFSKDSIQVRFPMWTNPEWSRGKTGMVSSHMCTDGVNIYYGGILAEGDHTFLYPPSFVFAKRVSDYSNVTFEHGVTTQPPHAPTDFVAYPSTIDNYQPPAGRNYYRVSGMAVEKTGKYLFVARDFVNSIHVLDKTTGELLHSLSYPVPTSLDVQGKYIWMVTQQRNVSKYPIKSDGTLGTPVLTLNGLVQPGTVKVTPDGSKVYVVDAGSSQQIKIFNSNTGALISTFGQHGGYVNNPEVADDKFMFKSSKDWQETGRSYPYNLEEIVAVPLTFDHTDNSYWLWDRGNHRVLHFSADNKLLEAITMSGYNYSCSIDYNDPKRVFSNYLEYEVDYTKPLDAAGAWKLKNNWAYNVSFLKDNQFARLQGAATLSNGKTYALNKVATGNEIVELSSTGLRFTGLIFSNASSFYNDGSIIIYNKGNGTANDPTTWSKKSLTGFDGSNNPVWGNLTTIASNTNGQISPANDGTSLKHQQITSSNILAYFDEERSGGYHLGGMKVGGNKWLWRTSPSTHVNYRGEFPTDGTFDIGNGINYAGGSMQAVERNIFYGYKGENYKQNQVNKFNHYYDNGLMVGQFGVVGADATLAEEAAAMMAGNTTTMAIVKVGTEYYLYHNDEQYHGGVHRWKISGLNSIKVQTLPVIKQGTPNAQVLDYINLMADLPFNDTVINNTAGWTRNPATGNQLSLTTNYTTYKSNEKDILFTSGGDKVSLSRDLGKNLALNNWKITGEVAYPEASEPGENFIDILDKSDRVIVRISRPETWPTLTIKANNSIFVTEQLDALYSVIRKLQPLKIVMQNGQISVSYANYSTIITTALDSLADLTSPQTLRIAFYSPKSAAKKIDVANFRFYKNIESTNLNFRSNSSGTWNDLSLWLVSPDTISWFTATELPSLKASSINILHGHLIKVIDSLTIDQLVIQDGGTLQVAPNASLKVNDDNGEDIIISPTGSLVIQSDSTGTGRITNSAGTILGDVTVEQYIRPLSKSSYQLLSPSVNTVNSSKPFIKDNWQEGQNNTTTTTNINLVPHFGMHITGSTSGTNGFDATTSGTASMFTSSPFSDSSWEFVLNTDATILEAKKGYLVQIRGDRSVNPESDASPTGTTLRTTGKILSGTQTFTKPTGERTSILISNPYPCPIDWNKAYNDASTANARNFEKYYIYWDPNIGTNGGYINVGTDGTKNAMTNGTTVIQSGRAFLITPKSNIVSPTFTVTENHKSSINSRSSFRTTARQQFMSSLHYLNSEGTRVMADGVNVIFDQDYSAAVDENDAKEISNPDENIAILQQGIALSIEERPFVENNDTITLSVQRLKTQYYEWQFDPLDFAQKNINAYLEDHFLNTRTRISLEQVTIVPFRITSDALSNTTDRFQIVFSPNITLPVTFTLVKAYQKASGVQLEWKIRDEVNIYRYEIEQSVDGKIFHYVSTINAESGNSLVGEYEWFDANAKEGSNYYRIKSIDHLKGPAYSTIVNTIIKAKQGSLDVYPNPVKGNYSIVHFNDLKKALYTIKLVDRSGAIIYSSVVEHPGGSVNQIIPLDARMPSGLYTFQIAGNGQSFTRQIFK